MDVVMEGASSAAAAVLPAKFHRLQADRPDPLRNHRNRKDRSLRGGDDITRNPDGPPNNRLIMMHDVRFVVAERATMGNIAR